ncbi:AEC family transporter [Pseudopelagicola sp. nBUS_20]|uniref:AEC family transporter n=1 Tax=Pseudopelagicola sp. nBUS_20 TaxID=3395317 RepID=UPI003EBA48B1
METLISVILPVFILIGFGYLAAWRGFFTKSNVDGIMRYATSFAVPVLLFRAIASLDLSADYDLAMIASFYTGAFISFLAGVLGARYLFGRNWEDATAIGFVCLFSNSVLLGLSITERAFGSEALAGNYALVSIHAPFCYGLGIAVMEFIRARSTAKRRIVPQVLKGMFSNAIILGIALGFIVNVAQISLPSPVNSAVTLMAASALPVAVFAIGGVLYRYRPEGDMRIIFYCCGISLFLHPAITWTLGTNLGLSLDSFRSAVLTSTMAPGINVYLFASMYGRAQRIAASTVLIATAASVGTIWLWLLVIP